MKKIIFFLFISMKIVYSQSDSTALVFYPLKNGNKWEYKVRTHSYPTYNESYFINEIICDTFISATAKNYKKIYSKSSSNDPNNYYYIYERIDTTTYQVYRLIGNQDYLWYHLNVNQGDSAVQNNFLMGSMYYTCINIVNNTILNFPTITKTFGYNYGLEQYGYRLSADFGLTEYHYSYPDYSTSAKLIYAKIDGVEYGDRNDPPDIISISDSIANINLSFTSDIVVIDPDNDQISITLNNKPAWLYATTVGGYQLYGVPTDTGVFIFEIMAKDKRGLEDRQNFSISVLSNHTPIIISLPEIYAFPNKLYTYQVSANDIDPEPLFYRFDISPDWLQIDEQSGLIQGTPSNNDAGYHEIVLIVEDSRGEFDLQEFSIFVLAKFQLSQNYPNPFNNSTTFEVAVPEKGTLQLHIFDITGKKVYEQDIGDVSPAVHQLHWNGLSNSESQVASGVYFYRIILEEKTGLKKIQTRKMMLLR